MHCSLVQVTFHYPVFRFSDRAVRGFPSSGRVRGGIGLLDKSRCRRSSTPNASKPQHGLRAEELGCWRSQVLETRGTARKSSPANFFASDFLKNGRRAPPWGPLTGWGSNRDRFIRVFCSLRFGYSAVTLRKRSISIAGINLWRKAEELLSSPLLSSRWTEM
jgi:hypothetical protein